MLMRLVNNTTGEIIEAEACPPDQMVGLCFICKKVGQNYIRSMAGGVPSAVIFFCDEHMQALVSGSWTCQVSNPLPKTTSLRIMVGSKETARFPVN